MGSRLNILLVAPTALNYTGNPIKQRKLYLPCLTLANLAALVPENAHVSLVFETIEEIPFDKHWDIVALTGMGSGIIRAWQIASEFRKKGITTVIGGIAASLADPALSLLHSDAVVVGEAEELWPHLIKDFGGNKLQKIYKSDKMPPVKNIPLPRYDLMNKMAFGKWLPVQATRGCPYTCNFCSVTSFFSNSYRKIPIENVIRDVRSAKKYGSRYIAFIDDNIAGDFNYCQDLFEALVPEKIIWMSQASINLAERPDLLKLAYKSGCRLLSFGIESLNRQSLKFINKEWHKPGEYDRAIHTIRSNGIDVSTEMILGIDGDDLAIFHKTYDFIMRNKISVSRIHILTPVPGTPLFNELDKMGRIVNYDYTCYTGGNVVFKPQDIDPVELKSRYWELYQKLYSWKSIFKRILPNKANLGMFMRAVTIGTNLHYRYHIKNKITPGIV